MKLCILSMMVMLGSAPTDMLAQSPTREVKRMDPFTHLAAAAVNPSASKATKDTDTPPAMPKAVKWILIISGVSPLLAGLARLLQLKMKAKGSDSSR